MILLFPDASVLRLVIGVDGLIQPEVLSAPATVSTDGARLAVETDAKFSRKQLAEFSALGVVGSRQHVGEERPVGSWPEIVPVEKLSTLPVLSSSAPVLFELPASDLPELAGELLRLGNDRQQLLTLTGPEGPQALLRVIGPPYYTLLRAVDDPAGLARAYVEAAPRAWVQIGFRHPLAGLIKPADGQILLLGPQHRWKTVPDGPFRDIYEALDIQLPASRVDWVAAASVEKFTVSLKLTAGGGTDVPELWVLRGKQAERALDDFVRESDSRLLSRLKFAVADSPSGRVIVIRTASSRQEPPAVEIPGAVGFRPFSKLPNLYVPVGRRIAPNLRRDAVRSLLADDPDQLVWLVPEGDQGFIPESVPETAFRPLSEWVEYVISEHTAPLAEWVAATTFDFEPFICGEVKQSLQPRPADHAPKPRKPTGKTPTSKPASTETPPAQPTTFTAEPILLTPATANLTVEWRARREVLEKQFLAVDGPLDHPARIVLWPGLAEANAGANEPSEAAICWLNAAWQTAHHTVFVERWATTEFTNGPPASATAFEKLLSAPAPTPGEARRTIAAILATAVQSPPPGWFQTKLSSAQQYLTEHESKLPVRAAWLTAVRLAELSGADALGLARVRDRLLARLLEEGLSPERDLPGFLRFAGLTDSERVRVVRAGTSRLHDTIRRWCEISLGAHKELMATDRTATLGYVDLLFAFGLARLGDTSSAEQLTVAARRVFEQLPTGSAPAIAADWLADAYGYRVQQACAGKSHTGGLPIPLMDRLAALRSKAAPKGQQFSDQQRVPDSLEHIRYRSRVLEPFEALHYQRTYLKAQQVQDSLLGVERLTDPATISRRLRELYDSAGDGRPTPLTRALVLETGLSLAHRGGQELVVDLLGRTVELLATTPPADVEMVKKYGTILERALLLAGFYDRDDVVKRLVGLFLDVVAGRPDDQRAVLVSAVTVQALRSLRRFGQRDEIDRLASRLPDLVFGGLPVVGALARYRGKLGVALAGGTSAALAVAATWNAVGMADRATKVLDEAEQILIGPTAGDLKELHYPEVVSAYLAATGFGPADVGLERMTRLFVAMQEERLAKLVKNGRVSAPLFSVFHIGVTEAAVLAVAGDEFAFGQAGRRWLEEDEQLVRRRLHLDMARVLEHGL